MKGDRSAARTMRAILRTLRDEPPKTRARDHGPSVTARVKAVALVEAYSTDHATSVAPERERVSDDHPEACK